MGASQKIKAVMEEHVKTLGARGISGPAATALSIASGTSLGPAVDMVELLKDEEEGVAHIDGEDDVSDSDASSDDLMSDDEGEEEEEEVEGEESEEESMSDV